MAINTSVQGTAKVTCA